MAEIELHDEITAWLDTLTQDEWDRVVVLVDRLAELGSTARMPFSRSLGDGLFELRFTCEGVNRRITYVFDPNRTAVTLTTFRKQRQNERGEIVRARRAQAAQRAMSTVEKESES